MGVILFGKTECRVCKELIMQDESIYSFASFIHNKKDNLFQFNDETIHQRCFRKSELALVAKEFSEKFFEATKPPNRICSVGKSLIKNENDYIFIDVLTSNSEENLSKFNLLTLDKNNLSKWVLRNEFIDHVLKFQKEGKWEDFSSFKYLDYLLDKVRI